MKNFTVFKFDPTCCKILQDIATGWQNVCNILSPTMLQDVALKCSKPLARPSNHKMKNICANTTGLKFCRVDVLQKLHIVIAVIILR